QGAVPGGQTSMEQCLSKDPNINVVYAINEPAAEGAGTALKAAHKTGVIVAAIDGGCAVSPYLQNGEVTATSAQFPAQLAARGGQSLTTAERIGDRTMTAVIEPTGEVRESEELGARVQHTLHRHPAIGPASVLVASVLVFSLINHRFLNATNLSLMIQQVAVL